MRGERTVVAKLCLRDFSFATPMVAVGSVKLNRYSSNHQATSRFRTGGVSGGVASGG
jgi:hypothetical protein